MYAHNVASLAKSLISSASRRLGVATPAEDVSDIVDGTLSYPLGPHRGVPLSPHYAETTPEHLAFVVQAEAPGITPADRVENATRALSRIVERNFGREARHWLDGKTETMRGGGYLRSASMGARFGGSFDRNGCSESFAQYEWGPQLMDTLPAALYRVVRAAMEALPGLTPALSTVRCGRSSGSHQVSFELDRPLALAALQPLMDQLGLGSRHAGLMSALAFVLGARFTLPPDTCLLTLRPTRSGIEMRMDVNLDALPDPPAQLMALMRLQMTERPKSLQGLDRWMLALTPDGYPGPGTVSVLSVWVRPDLPARLALFLRPALFETGPSPAATPSPAPRSPMPVSAAAQAWAVPDWAPMH